MPAQKILSEQQWQILLGYMEANPIFAKGIAGVRSGQVAKAEDTVRWKTLACKLNNVSGGCTKNSFQWRDYWNNTKYKVRKKAYIIRKQMKLAGNDGSLQGYHLLTINEKRVLTCLRIPIPGHVQIKIKSPPVSPTPDELHSSLDISPPHSDMSPTATQSNSNTPPDTPMPQIKSDPDPLHCNQLEQKDNQAASSMPEWVRDIEERRIAVEERSAQALQGILANTEFCVNALQGMQFAQECLNKTMQGIQVALESSAIALQERHN